jgi:hypothetical protein
MLYLNHNKKIKIMARSTDRMTAQDRVLGMFNRDIRNSNISEAKPLTLAQQLKQVTYKVIKVNPEIEIERRNNSSIVVRVRNNK